MLPKAAEHSVRGVSVEGREEKKMITKKEVVVGKKTLVFETGRIARQANGAVMCSYGESMVLSTVCIDSREKNIGFIPLVVDYRERKSAGGKIPGGFFKREGAPSVKEILTCRLIDRSVRPQLPKGLNRETQFIGTALSADPEQDTDIMAMNGAFAALAISSVPHEHILAAVRVGYVDGEMVFNPSEEELDQSKLNLVIAGNSSALVMVEGEVKILPEEIISEALVAAHGEIKNIIKVIRELAEETGKEKLLFPAKEKDLAIDHTVRELAGNRFYEQMTTIADKLERMAAVKLLKNEIVEEMTEKLADEDGVEEQLAQVKSTLKELEREVIRGRVVKEGIRLDGRQLEEVREISIETGILPRTHGSILFTRGETQAIVTTTLGTGTDEQKVEELTGEYWSNFLLHYNFPPYSVNEVRFLRGPSRREKGHGTLAKRALLAVLPEKESFPYTMRVLSDVTESNGSSSMATVCGGSLSLMDAGVPIAAPVAGVAMGLINEGDDYHILTDILGDEDHVGDMDFKVAGTREGITALQMDIKLDGLPTDVLKRALEQAKRGRIHILDIMDKVLDKHRDDLSPYAPRIMSIQIPRNKIGALIGPGGKNIRAIIEETGVTIDVDDEGMVVVASADLAALEAGMERVKASVAEPEVGATYEGKVVRIMNFGAFVEIMPGKDGLVHISEMAWGRTNSVEDVCKIGDKMTVKLMEVDSQGRVNLSRKALMPKPEGYVEPERKPREDRGGRGGDRNRRSGGNDRGRGRR